MDIPLPESCHLLIDDLAGDIDTANFKLQRFLAAVSPLIGVTGEGWNFDIGTKCFTRPDPVAPAAPVKKRRQRR
jgi:hypothetical protein